MTTSLTTRSETVTSVITQEETISFLTTKHETSSPVYEGTTVSVTSQEGTPSSLVRTHQGPVSTFTTTQVSPTTAQDYYTHGLVAIVGHSISLPCFSTVVTKFRWQYCPLGSRIWSTIYNGAKIISNELASRLTVSNRTTKKCTLQVHELRLDAAGTISCRKSDGHKFWSLTVLGK